MNNNTDYIKRHLIFYSIKQVLFIIISLIVFLIGTYALKGVVGSFIDYLLKGSNGDIVQNIVSFFVGLFVILILGVIVVFILAIVATILAGILVNYIVNEMDVVQRNKSLGVRIKQSVIPTLAGIGAVLFGSYLFNLIIPEGLINIMISPILQFLFLYLPVNYILDRKYYLENL